jgi:hypothetical protein
MLLKFMQHPDDSALLVLFSDFLAILLGLLHNGKTFTHTDILFWNDKGVN